MKLSLLAFVLALAACGKSGASTTDAKAIYETQADYTHDMCKCVEGSGVDPKACAEKIDARRAPWFAKVKANMQAGKIQVGDTAQMLETTMHDYQQCAETAGVSQE